jgi:NADH:ubiquinone oxidoreductase subunit 3 (subunit A)
MQQELSKKSLPGSEYKLTYYLTIILICLFTIIWLFVFISALLTNSSGIFGIIILGCLIFIFAKLAHDKFSNKEDNYYDDHVDK